jgi:predicted MFS family arabinose efflux permease
MSARTAVTTVFFLNGAVFSSWYARLPAIQDDIGLGPGALGVALLGAPAGLLAAQPLVGVLIARRGSRAAVAASPLYMPAVVLPALAFDTASLLVAVTAVGAINGTLDIAMNAQGLAVERAGARRIFSSLHASFSFGALAGAGLAGALAALGVAPLLHLAGVAVVGGAAAAAVAPHLLGDEEAADARAPRLARPSGRLAALGVIAFCALLAEGAVFDWSGIYLATEAAAPAGVAPLGLAAFSLSMGVGRLAADPATERAGAPRVAAGGAASAALALGLALAVPTPAGAMLGFAAMGLGLSAVFPLALRASGLKDPSAAPGLAAVSTVGYAGSFLGPPLIGLLAEATSLPAALLLVCVLCLIASTLAGHLREPTARPARLDVRGRGDSDREFVPHRRDAQDGMEPIEWIAEQPGCDGNVAPVGLLALRSHSLSHCAGDRGESSTR